jgi:hypothetical protein
VTYYDPAPFIDEDAAPIPWARRTYVVIEIAVTPANAHSVLMLRLAHRACDDADSTASQAHAINHRAAALAEALAPEHPWPTDEPEPDLHYSGGSPSTAYAYPHPARYREHGVAPRNAMAG